MKNAIINLLKLKSIMSLLVMFTTCILVIKGKIDTQSFMIITTAIITYYFNKDKKEE